MGEPPDLDLSRDLQWLNCSAQAFVATVAAWAESVVGEPGQPTFSWVSYQFFHSEESQGERAARQEGWQESLAQCQGLSVRCRDLVVQEASVGSKGLAEYLTGVISNVGASESWLPVTGMFGWRPAHTFTVSQYDAGVFAKNESIRLECGGGSGAGFQVLCDETLVLTAGGGGGGGMEGRPTLEGNRTDFSVGGGGGGGAQFRYPPWGRVKPDSGLQGLGAWVSVGGGGGCGTCDTHDGATGDQCLRSRERLLCGQRLDDNAATDPQHSALLNDTLAGCRRAGSVVRIIGGGGGGGGTAECCEGYDVGYGFSFELRVSPLPPQPPSHSGGGASKGKPQGKKEGRGQKKKKKKQKHEGQGYEHGHEGHHHHHHHWGGRKRALQYEPPEAVAQQLKYDHLFRYLYGASQQCVKGFQDWCCVCERAQQQIVQDGDASLAWFASIACCSCQTDNSTTTAATPTTTGAGGFDSRSDSRPWRPDDDALQLPMRPLPTGSACQLVVLPPSTGTGPLAVEAAGRTAAMAHLRAEGGQAQQGGPAMWGEQATGLQAAAVGSPSTSLLEGGVSLLVLLVVCGIISLVRLKALWYPLLQRSCWGGGGVTQSIRGRPPGRPPGGIGEYGAVAPPGGAEDASL